MAWDCPSIRSRTKVRVGDQARITQARWLSAVTTVLTGIMHANMLKAGSAWLDKITRISQAKKTSLVGTEIWWISTEASFGLIPSA